MGFHFHSNFSVLAGIGVGIYFLVKQTNSAECNAVVDSDAMNDWTPVTAKWVENKEIQILRQYLRFETVTKNKNYGDRYSI